MTGKEKIELKDGVINIFNRFNTLDNTATIGGLRDDILRYINSLQEEPVSEDLEAASETYAKSTLVGSPFIKKNAFKAGAKWQKQKDQETIELAEDHAYFAGRVKTVDEVKEKLISEVLPCFMHGGEADEVVAKLDEVLNRKK